MRKHLIVATLVMLGLFIAWVAGVYAPMVFRVDTDPDAIVAAMANGRISSTSIIWAIRRNGNVDDTTANGTSFVTAAVFMSNAKVLRWLLENGADPNPASGRHPLMATKGMSDGVVFQHILLGAGSRWPNPQTQPSTSPQREPNGS